MVTLQVLKTQVEKLHCQNNRSSFKQCLPFLKLPLSTPSSRISPDSSSVTTDVSREEGSIIFIRNSSHFISSLFSTHFWSYANFAYAIRTFRVALLSTVRPETSDLAISLHRALTKLKHCRERIASLDRFIHAYLSKIRRQNHNDSSVERFFRE